MPYYHRVLESMIRSCSNLIERFHHSTNTYVLISKDRYIDGVIFFLVALIAIAALFLIAYHFGEDSSPILFRWNPVFSVLSLCNSYFAIFEYLSFDMNYHSSIILCSLSSICFFKRLQVHSAYLLALDILSCFSLAFTNIFCGILLSWLTFLKFLILIKG